MHRAELTWERPLSPHLQKPERRASSENPRGTGGRGREQFIHQRWRGSNNWKRPALEQRRGRSPPGPTPTLPTASCTAVLTVASSLNTEDTFRKAETTFSGSEVSV